jgi:2-succinyl-5-enolpyruvyl-6-hydroxy-3-cyclohexene-1-carboxylate synthase
MIHHLQHIVDLVEICRRKDIKYVVVSPGSRNAPIIKQILSNSSFRVHSIVDERSAAFFGLGLSIATHEPVILVCTSGSAGLNYAPALAEAFYQHVPLVAITADRPPWLIGQQDNQSIRQDEMFRNYIKCSMNVKIPIEDEQQLQHFHQDVDNVLNCAVETIKGPVHVNCPIDEPLYTDMPQVSKSIKLYLKGNGLFSGFNRLKEYWKKSRRPVIIVGQQNTDSDLRDMLNRYGVERKVVVLGELVANIAGRNVIGAVDRVMMKIEDDESDMFKPDFMVSLGGHVISKRLKKWLQKMNIPHFRISEMEDGIDTYGNLTENIIGDPVGELSAILSDVQEADSGFVNAWHEVNDLTLQSHNMFLKEAPFSDIKVFDVFMNKLPKGAIVHFGNSSPIRYGQLFKTEHLSGVFSNRGVSGIDGCLSTAVGYASQTNRLNFVFIGDLGFVYDSNAMWNRNLPKNLKVILINNSGGGIFRLLNGPTSINGFNGFDDYIETSHRVDIRKLVEAFGLAYFYAQNVDEVESQFDLFIQSGKASVFEVKTPQTENSTVYRQYIEAIKQK